MGSAGAALAHPQSKGPPSGPSDSRGEPGGGASLENLLEMSEDPQALLAASRRL